MGCDIHLYVERLDGEQWVTADTWEPSQYENEEGMVIPRGARFYEDRNYYLFSMLADVRNRRALTPISPPRGLPEPMSPEVARAAEGWGPDGHSHSWHTLDTLMSYDWTQTADCAGQLHAWGYFQWTGWRRENGEGPRHYAQSIMGSGIQYLEPDQMDAKLAALKELHTTEGVVDWPKYHAAIETDLDRLVCCATWTQSYYQLAHPFLSHTLPRLWRLARSPEHWPKVRVVFWFDN